MNEIAIQIPGATVKGMLLESYSPEDKEVLDQDVLEVELPNGARIDVGWFPEGDPSGQFVIRVYRRNLLSPVRSPVGTKSPHQVARIVKDIARTYLQPGIGVEPVAFTTSAPVVRFQMPLTGLLRPVRQAPRWEDLLTVVNA